SLGQVLFNETLPSDYPWVERVAGKDALSDIVNDLAERYPKVVTAATLDNLKDAGFKWATRSGITVAISDITSNMDKTAILAPYEIKATRTQSQYDKGVTADAERRQDLIAIWTKPTDEVAAAMQEGMEELNTISRMVTSKA